MSTPVSVSTIAELANLTIAPEDLPKFEKHLSAILTYIEKLSELDLKTLAKTEL